MQVAQQRLGGIDRRTLVRRAAECFAVAAVGVAASPGRTEPGYPNRPVRIIVPYGPGGIADTSTRISPPGGGPSSPSAAQGSRLSDVMRGWSAPK